MYLKLTVRRIVHKSPRPARGRFRFLPPTLPSLFLCLLSLFGLTSCTPAAARVDSPVSSKLPGPSFAIADFDGDLHPDLASVEVASINSRHTIYSIQLRLTAVGRQVIRVAAPSGGLQILARDVNGDHAIDLVLATAALGEPVAVLLNDGHGGFKQADRSDSPGALGNSGTALTSEESSLSGAVDAPPPARSDISVVSSSSPLQVSKTLDAALHQPPFLSEISLTSGPCRAPPHTAPLL